MKDEVRELYVYTKDHFIKDLKEINPTCVSPIIAIRQIVKKAIEQYIKDYGNSNEIFSHEDFMAVSDKINEEIKNEELEN